MTSKPFEIARKSSGTRPIDFLKAQSYNNVSGCFPGTDEGDCCTSYQPLIFQSDCFQKSATRTLIARMLTRTLQRPPGHFQSTPSTIAGLREGIGMYPSRDLGDCSYQCEVAMQSDALGLPCSEIHGNLSGKGGETSICQRI